MPEDRSILTRKGVPPDKVVVYGTMAPEQVADVRDGGERACARPLIMIIHGGFWRPTIDRTHSSFMADALASLGWTVVVPEYRRIPGRPELTLSDINEALMVLPGLLNDHNAGVIIVGHSAGGHLALWAAATGAPRSVRGILALAPVADLTLAHEHELGDGAVEAFLGEEPSNYGDIDPRRLSAPRLPVTIVHGEEDGIVPLWISESYVSNNTSARLVRLDGVGHLALVDPSTSAWPVVVQELERLCREHAANCPV